MSAPKKKNFQIEAFKHRVVVDPKYPEKTWKILEHAIHEIYNHNASGLSFEELYRNAYNMVLHKFGEKLYSGLVTTMTSHLSEISKSIEAAQGELFLEELNRKWADHNKALQMIRDILMYMDRTFIPSTHKTPVHELGLSLWRDVVIHSSKTQTRLRDTLLELVHRERNGEVINRGLMRNIIKMLMDLGSSVYQEDFEHHFLEVSADFYRLESQQFIECCDCGDYLKKAERRLNEEMERVSHYLDTRSLDKITNVVEKEMIESHMQRLVHMENSGLVNMLVNDKYEDLGRMYNLFRRVPTGLSIVRDVMTSYIRGTGKQLVTDPERLRDPVDFVQRLLDLKDKYDKIISSAFSNDKTFQNALNSSFEYFINLNTRSPEFISLFVDDKLRKGLRGVSEEDVEVVLDKVMMLFRYLQEKDVFEKYYKQHLAKRLLAGKTVSDDAERSLIVKLKTECGYQFTSKLEGMFTDMKTSQDTMQGFYASHGPELGDSPSLAVQVLTTGSWPTQPSATCNLPAEILGVCENSDLFSQPENTETIMSSLSVLNEDLLVRVYTKLSSEKDRKTWRLVCRDFLRVDSATRRSLRVLRFEFLQSLLSKHTNLDSLDLSVCPRVEDGTVSVLLSRPESKNWTRCVTRLTLSRATGLRYSGLEMLVRACPCLEALDVSHCWKYGDREASAISCAEGLRELRMDKCVGVSDVGLAKIAVGCGRLERLSLKWCMEISDLGVDLLCKKCLGLKDLDVSYLKVTCESLRSIASLPKLEVLAIVGCPLVDYVGLRFLENRCPLLQVIDVSRCDLVSSSGLISVVTGHRGLLQLNAGFCFSELRAMPLHCLKDLKNLNTIRIDGAQVSDSSFQIISTNCKSLVEIGLNKCIGVTNTGIMQLVSGCVDLKIVNLTCCRSLTDAALSALANSCRKLVCLKLESCDMVTEKSLDQLGSCCLRLKELDLTDCCGVNDKGLDYLSRCSELSCLKLGLCTNITDKGLVYIARNCTKITELDLYRCTSIGDDGLAALLSGCKKLTKLNLSYCSGITDRGMQYICHFEDLSDLEMRGLVNITSMGLTAVAAGCKRLADLDLKHCETIDDSGFWALAYYSRNLRQINMSYCAISDLGLCMVMGNLTRLQDAKLVHLTKVTVKGFELALRACSVRIRKVKLIRPLRCLLSSEILETLHETGCKIRWD